MVLVRIAYVADMPTPDEAIRMLEQNSGTSPVIGSSVPRSAPAAPSSSMQSPPPRTASAPRASADASPRPHIAEPMADAQSAPTLKLNNFAELVALAAEKRDLMTKAALEADIRLVRIEDGRLEVALERSAARTLINDLSRKLEQWTGRRWTVIVSNEAGQPTLRSQAQLKQSERERSAESDPRVKEVLARFPGAKVVEVRKLAPEPPESDATGEDPAEFSDSDDQ
jgi:DNA polymerase-3 subunit gamma/tau